MTIKYCCNLKSFSFFGSAEDNSNADSNKNPTKAKAWKVQTKKMGIMKPFISQRRIRYK